MEPRSYRGVAQQDRVAARRDALIAAGLDCLHDDGLSGASVRAICARARLTPRYFYENFADLDELLVSVVDSVAAEVAAAALAAVAAAPWSLPAQVRALVDAGYGVVAQDRRKAAALLVAAAGHGPLVDRRQRIVLDYVDLALAHVPALEAANRVDRRAARATALFLMGGSVELIGAVLSGTLRLSRESVVDRLSALWVAALNTQP
jgi:AcrR family transcriptional regulator